MKNEKVEPAYVPQTPLEKLIHAGDANGTLSYLSGIDTGALSGHRKAVRRVAQALHKARYVLDASATAWRAKVTSGQIQSLRIANFACGTSDDQIDSCWEFVRHESEFLGLWRQFPPADAQAVAEAMIARSPRHFSIVQALYLAGLISRPVHDNYVLGLLALPIESDRVLSVRKCLERDPGLVHDTLPRLFEIEGTSDNSLAGQDKYGHGLTSPRNTWVGLFMELCEQGVYSRATLIDKALGTLEKDWIQFRAGWFSPFHDALAPDVTEMAPFAERYMGLCHSRIAPTVTLALNVLGQLFDAGVIGGGDLVAALQPVLCSSVKAQVESALKALDRAVASDASLSAIACATAIPAFGHPAAEVHKKLIARLRAWGMDDTAKQLAREFLPHVSTANSDALAALIGDATAFAANKKAGPAGNVPMPKPPLSPVDDRRRLVPIENIDELVEQTAYVFEHPVDTDEFERVLDALLRLNVFAFEDKRRLGPVLKRARQFYRNGEMWRAHEKPVTGELARLLIFLLDGERLPPPSTYAKGHFSAHALLCERIDGLMHFAAHESGLSALAAPTHRRGFIAPRVLVERIRRHHELGIDASRHEQVLSLLRLAPATDEDVLAGARSLPPTPYALALRYALGDRVEIGPDKALFVAAGRIRHPDEDDVDLIRRFGDLGPDGPHVARYVFSVTGSTSGNHTFSHGQVDTMPAVRDMTPAFISITRHAAASSNAGSFSRGDPFGGENEAMILFSATVLPSSLEAFFAEGLRAISNNLDWWEANWHHKAYLTLLLDPTVPFTAMAYWTLASALAGKEPGQTSMAIDALVDGWVHGRLEAARLATVLRALMQTPLVKLPRYAKSLTLAARAHEHAPRLVFDLLCEAIRFDTDVPPKDTAALLELLLGVAIELSERLPGPTRLAVETMQISGKGKAARKELLERC